MKDGFMKISEDELKKHYRTFSIKNAKCLLKKNGRIQTLRYVAEHIETVGSHCLAILKLFEAELKELKKKTSKHYVLGLSRKL